MLSVIVFTRIAVMLLTVGVFPLLIVVLSSSSEVAQEQRDDPSLTGCWKLADKGRAGFVVKDNLLYHRTKRFWARISTNLWCLRVAGLMF